MKRTNVDQISRMELDSHPLFTGPVSIQLLLTDETAKQLGILMVRFRKGVRNKFHSHSTDQVLFVTSGKGVVATEQEQVEIRPGDVIHIPAGEKHWHGATEDSEMSHLAIEAAGGELTQIEK
jgi:quercetin dioxygenase-like cupin family protein